MRDLLTGALKLSWAFNNGRKRPTGAFCWTMLLLSLRRVRLTMLLHRGENAERAVTRVLSYSSDYADWHISRGQPLAVFSANQVSRWTRSDWGSLQNR